MLSRVGYGDFWCRNDNYGVAGLDKASPKRQYLVPLDGKISHSVRNRAVPYKKLG
jgi:hypothetical protein